MKLQPGDIVLIRGKSFISKFVRFFTKSEYTHAAMMISERHMIEANFNKKVNIVNFKYNPETMEIYRYKEDLTKEQQIVIVQSSYEMLNKYYDYLQVIFYMIEYFIGKRYDRMFNLQSFIICSEIIDRAYSEIEINLVEKSNMTPGDLVMSKEIKRIY
ncbi:enoyl-CoA hydratase/carnithine racemase-like [Bacillus phage G]|uniref:Protein OPG091 n=1 Tax=Bacillus phage G TaxID=2884420 RepID=G3MBS8_9CAUD|nr:enoyl-CoA hydratase/carnithine racemase-like [Bacillus phage G]AEO93471.1 gp212 [Bacillus phage G]